MDSIVILPIVEKAAHDIFNWIGRKISKGRKKIKKFHELCMFPIRTVICYELPGKW